MTNTPDTEETMKESARQEMRAFVANPDEQKWDQMIRDFRAFFPSGDTDLLRNVLNAAITHFEWSGEELAAGFNNLLSRDSGGDVQREVITALFSLDRKGVDTDFDNISEPLNMFLNPRLLMPKTDDETRLHIIEQAALQAGRYLARLNLTREVQATSPHSGNPDDDSGIYASRINNRAWLIQHVGAFSSHPDTGRAAIDHLCALAEYRGVDSWSVLGYIEGWAPLCDQEELFTHALDRLDRSPSPRAIDAIVNIGITEVGPVRIRMCLHKLLERFSERDDLFEKMADIAEYADPENATYVIDKIKSRLRADALDGTRAEDAIQSLADIARSSWDPRVNDAAVAALEDVMADGRYIEKPLMALGDLEGKQTAPHVMIDRIVDMHQRPGSHLADFASLNEDQVQQLANAALSYAHQLLDMEKLRRAFIDGRSDDVETAKAAAKKLDESGLLPARVADNGGVSAIFAHVEAGVHLEGRATTKYAGADILRQALIPQVR